MTGNATEIVQYLMRQQVEKPNAVYDLKPHRERRSLDANSYYWVILTKLADVLRMSKPRVHNMILRQYGQAEYFNGKLVPITLMDTDEAEKKAIESETFHVKPTSQIKVDKDGIAYRTYYLLRGSSQYNSYEFSILLDGLIEEAKEQGIETLPPAELEKMKAELRKQEEKNGK